MRTNRFWLALCGAILLLYIVAYLPFLLVSGCCAGAFTGLCAQFLIKRKILHYAETNTKAV